MNFHLLQMLLLASNTVVSIRHKWCLLALVVVVVVVKAIVVVVLVAVTGLLERLKSHYWYSLAASMLCATLVVGSS